MGALREHIAWTLHRLGLAIWRIGNKCYIHLSGYAWAVQGDGPGPWVKPDRPKERDNG